MTRKLTYEELEQRVKELEKEAFLRKQIEEALGASEKKYRLMVEKMNDGLGVQDANGLIS